MNLLYISTLVLTALLCGAYGKAPECPAVDASDHTDHLPHETDCGLFYRCNHGKPVLDYCPSGLHFNPVLQVCDWPANAGCKPGGGDIETTTAHSATTTAPSETTTAHSETTTAHSETTTAHIETTTAEYNECAVYNDQCAKQTGRLVLLPHPSDCNGYCRCNHNVSISDKCPEGLHFNEQLQICDWPGNAGCQGDCAKLVNKNGSHWEPQSCVDDRSEIDDVCKLKCDADYELSGSESIKCTDLGWNGSGGINLVPTCKSPEDLGEDIVDKINDTLHGIQAGMLFLLDESGSVAINEFEMQKDFVSVLVDAFYLSKNRSAGVITFSTPAAVDISLRQSDHCAFQKQLKVIKYTSGGTDILNALNTANKEIQSNAIHNKTLVFLITDGESQTDPTAAANLIKSQNHTLFTIGVANYNRKQLEPLASQHKNGAQLFFGISSFDVFERVAEYLKTEFNGTSNVTCP